MTEPAADPRAKWRELPPRIHPEDWVTEQDPDPVPGAVLAGEAHSEMVKRTLESG